MVCEAFHCTPTQALYELQHAPYGLIDDLLECREFAAVKRAYDRAENKSQLPESPMLDVLREIVYDQVQACRETS